MAKKKGKTENQFVRRREIGKLYKQLSKLEVNSPKAKKLYKIIDTKTEIYEKKKQMIKMAEKKKLYREKTIRGKKHKYIGEFYTTKKHAEVAKESFKRGGFSVSAVKGTPTQKEIKKHREQMIKYLGFAPKRKPSKIYRIFYRTK